MDFRITGLPAQQFAHFAAMTDEQLHAHGARRYKVDAPDMFPDRIALRHGRIGESVLLVNYMHQSANSPYRASHAVYVLEGERDTFDAVNTVPEVIRPRLISLRAFDANAMMVDADVAEGACIEPVIQRLLGRESVSYLHAHFAKRGCFAARIERA
jgi:hypothetical protein